MPDEHYDDDEQEQDSSVIRELRKQLKQAKAEAAEVANLRQETALLKAGLNLTPLQQKALLAAHEGDLDAEALRKTAVELGIHVEPKPEAETPQVPADEQAALQRIADATAAAEPSEAQLKTLEDKMRAAKSPQELAAILDQEGLLFQDD